jgi:hypothetical protein
MASIPTLTSLSPLQGHDGLTLTINGTGLQGTIKVNFGAKQVNPTSVTATAVTCVIPEVPAGQYNVTVTTPNVTSNFLPFYYIAPPQVQTLGTHTGPAGATPLSVFGQALATATGVTFGPLGPGTGLQVVSDTTLQVITPAHGAFATGTCTDTVNVTVTSLGGVSIPQGSNSQYTFYQAPTVTGVLPTSASVGSLLTLNGSCLADVVSTLFTPAGGGPAVAARFTTISNTVMTTVVPSGLAVGTYNITVVTPGGQTLPVSFAVFTVPV